MGSEMCIRDSVWSGDGAGTVCRVGRRVERGSPSGAAVRFGRGGNAEGTFALTPTTGVSGERSERGAPLLACWNAASIALGSVMHACSDAASHWNVDMFGEARAGKGNAPAAEDHADCGRRRRTAPWSYPRASRPRATGDTPSTSRRREVPPRRSAMGSTLRLLTSPTPCGRMFAKRPEDDGTRPRIKSAFSGFDRPSFTRRRWNFVRTRSDIQLDRSSR